MYDFFFYFCCSFRVIQVIAINYKCFGAKQLCGIARRRMQTFLIKSKPTVPQCVTEAGGVLIEGGNIIVLYDISGYVRFFRFIKLH